MECLIQSTISALGFLEGDVYNKEPDCYVCARDLIRYLRNDTPDGLARRLCGERNIVQNDLIPILKSSTDEPQLFDVALRLLINLTQPASALFEGQPPKDRASWQIYAQLVRNLQNSKQAFADVQLFAVLGQRLKAFVELEWENRQEEERLVVERILTLLRYIFAIPNTEQDRQRTATDVNSQDQLIWALLDAKVDEILLFIASRQSEREFHIAVLEIFALILKEHTPSDLALAGEERSAEQKREAEQQLATAVAHEQQKAIAAARRLPARHSNFAGSYTIKGLKAVNATKDVVVGRPINDVDKVAWLEDRKAKRRTPKNRRPFDGSDRTHQSALNVRLRLKELCLRLLETAYNRLMRTAKGLISANNRRDLSMRNSDSHYLFLMRFAMEFRRLANTPLNQVSATVGVEAFHHVQTQLDSYLESARAEKTEAKRHGAKARYAIAAYKESLMTLQWMGQSGSAEDRTKADEITRHIFYVTEYRDLSASVLRKYQPAYLSKAFLRDLVLATHVYLRLLEQSCKAGNIRIVQRKRRRAKPKRKQQK
uniref:Timeless N-terminal domain-containing protein n=1 Tax=Plectus sambesii TaxID=2011161 RepID=A0A914X6L6_9BILA